MDDVPEEKVSPIHNLKSDYKQDGFVIDLHNILSLKDTRTTVMIKNIPNKYTQQMLLDTINSNHSGNYDFFYLPIDFKNKCNIGYAFINFIHPIYITEFFQEFNAQKWQCFNSNKICKITYGRIQGKKALENNFSNMQVGGDKSTIKVRPLILNPPVPSDEIIYMVR